MSQSSLCTAEEETKSKSQLHSVCSFFFSLTPADSVKVSKRKIAENKNASKCAKNKNMTNKAENKNVLKSAEN